MKILIKVTKDVLKESMYCISGLCNTENLFKQKEGIGFNCAIGIAVNKLFENAWVSRNKIIVYENFTEMNTGKDISIPLPMEAQNFIIRFDRLREYPAQRLNMEEFTFEIEVPQSVIDKIGIDEVHKILSESKTLELVSP